MPGPKIAMVGAGFWAHYQLAAWGDVPGAQCVALCDRDPVVNVFVASRVRVGGLDPARLGAQVWGHHADGRLASVCYAGANLVPVAATSEAIAAFGSRARAQGRRCSSLVGPADAIDELWRLLITIVVHKASREQRRQRAANSVGTGCPLGYRAPLGSNDRFVPG